MLAGFRTDGFDLPVDEKGYPENGKERFTEPEHAGPPIILQTDKTHVHMVSMSRLFREERAVTDPKFCEGFEILLVKTSNCVFLPTFNAETTISRRVWLDLYHKRGIHEPRSMDLNESVRLQLFCHRRD
jgi:hypothetical protein